MTTPVTNPARLAEMQTRRVGEFSGYIAAAALAIWVSRFDPQNPEETYPATRAALIELIRSWFPNMVDLGSRFYSTMRELAGFDGAFQPIPAKRQPREALVTSINATGIAVFHTALNSGQTLAQAKDTAGVTVSGAVSRQAVSGSRQTVHRSVEEDQRAVGYMRMPSGGGSCSFCAMILSRGVIFKTEESAGARGSGNRYHDHDDCIVRPVFEGSEHVVTDRARDLSEQWQRVTAGLSGAEARNAWRRYWESHHST